jgi:hypothetical protein
MERTLGAMVAALALIASAAVGVGGAAGREATDASTWTAQTVPTSGSRTPVLYDVAAVSPQVAWAVGSRSVANDSLATEVIKTIDGGRTWFIQYLPGTCCEARSIAAASPNTLFLVRSLPGGSSEVLRSPDGGTTFGFGGASPTPLWAVAAGSTTNGWAVGSAGKIMVTSDGLSWLPRSYPTTANLWATTAGSATVGWAVGDDGTILKTADAGRTWTAQPSGVSVALLGVSAVSSDVAWAVGQSGVVLRTADGGQSWSRATAPGSTNLIDVAATSATSAWGLLSYEAGVSRIVATTDGGATWTPQYTATVDSSRQLGGIFAVTPYAAWVVAGGQILATGPSYPNATRIALPMVEQPTR